MQRWWLGLVDLSVVAIGSMHMELRIMGKTFHSNGWRFIFYFLDLFIVLCRNLSQRIFPCCCILLSYITADACALSVSLSLSLIKVERFNCMHRKTERGKKLDQFLHLNPKTLEVHRMETKSMPLMGLSASNFMPLMLLLLFSTIFFHSFIEIFLFFKMKVDEKL